MASISTRILELVNEYPLMSNDEIADKVKKEFRGASTTAASVSSVKSNARKSGKLEAVAVSALAEDLEDEEPIPEDDGIPEKLIYDRIRERFDALHRMAMAVMNGQVPALIGAGPPGLGKSYGIMQAIEQRKKEYEQAWLDAPKTFGLRCMGCQNPVDEEKNDLGKYYCPKCEHYVLTVDEESGGEYKVDYITGAISAPGLYIALWNARNGGLIVLDDCDSVFGDEDTLNILKAVLDSCDKRIISWRKKSRWLAEEGCDPQFEFKGSIIFLTNKDFEKIVDSGKAMAVHFKALMDRCLYLHLTIRTMRDFIVRIKQVVYEENMLDKYNLPEGGAEQIMKYVYVNRRRFTGLSLRLIHQIALLKTADPTHWEKNVEMTKMKAFTEELVDKEPSEEVWSKITKDDPAAAAKPIKAKSAANGKKGGK
jgi:hypothetical protein